MHIIPDTGGDIMDGIIRGTVGIRMHTQREAYS
jgi:hypothetical protein